MIVTSNKNKVGRVVFSKIAKVGSITVNKISDIDSSDRKDGDVLFYSSNTASYFIGTLPTIDGGTF